MNIILRLYKFKLNTQTPIHISLKLIAEKSPSEVLKTDGELLQYVTNIGEALARTIRECQLRKNAILNMAPNNLNLATNSKRVRGPCRNYSMNIFQRLKDDIFNGETKMFDLFDRVDSPS